MCIDVKNNSQHARHPKFSKMCGGIHWKSTREILKAVVISFVRYSTAKIEIIAFFKI